MKITIILSGTGGELDRQTIDVGDNDSASRISADILNALEVWTLALGDTIKIKEVD